MLSFNLYANIKLQNDSLEYFDQYSHHVRPTTDRISSNTVADDQLVLFLALHFVARALHTASKVYNIKSHNCLLVIFIHYLLSFYLTKTKLKKERWENAESKTALQLVRPKVLKHISLLVWNGLIACIQPSLIYIFPLMWTFVKTRFVLISGRVQLSDSEEPPPGGLQTRVEDRPGTSSSSCLPVKNKKNKNKNKNSMKRVKINLRSSYATLIECRRVTFIINSM